MSAAVPHAGAGIDTLAAAAAVRAGARAGPPAGCWSTGSTITACQAAVHCGLGCRLLSDARTERCTAALRHREGVERASRTKGRPEGR